MDLVNEPKEQIVRLSDLIGVISDDFKPSLKIIDSRIISSDIHSWATEPPDDLAIPFSPDPKSRYTGKKVLERLNSLSYNIKSILLSKQHLSKKRSSRKGSQLVCSSVNPHSDKNRIYSLSDYFHKDKNFVKYNTLSWKHWEDNIILDGCDFWDHPSGHTTPSGSSGSLVMMDVCSPNKTLFGPSSSSLNVPKITITSPVRAISPGGSRLGESSTTLLMQHDAEEEEGPDLSCHPLPTITISPLHTNIAPRLIVPNYDHLGWSSSSSIKPQSQSLNSITSAFVKKVKNKVLNPELDLKAWDSYIIWDDETYLKNEESFHSFFQPFLSEMDPSLTLEKMEEPHLIPNNKKSHSDLALKLTKETSHQSYIRRLEPCPVPRSLSFSQVVDKYNISGDKYYLPREMEDKGIGSTLSPTATSPNPLSVTLIHSIPALKLAKPFYKAWMTKSELRAFHRHVFGARYAPKITFKTGEEIQSSPLEESNNFLPHHSIHSSEMIPRSVRELSILPTSGGPQPHILMVEYSEEFPILVQKEGMGSLLYRYTRNGSTKPVLESGPGISHTLSRNDPSPFLGFGDVRPGQTVFAIQNNLFRAPLFKHRSESTDFLLVRQWNDGVAQPCSLLELPPIWVAGQTLPMVEVIGPQSRKANIYCKNRVEVAAYRQYQRPGNLSKRAKISKICRAFPQFQESVLKKWLKDTSDYLRVSREVGWWIQKKTAPSLSEDELRALMTPEMVCIYEAMLVGKQRLLDAGLGHLVDDESSTTSEDESLSTSTLMTEIKLAPWNITRNFILATQGKALVELIGAGDPTGCGEGFSFNRIPLKSTTFHQKKWHPSDQNSTTISVDEEKKYSIAEQQQAYKEQIMKIWDAQYLSLSNSNRLSQLKGESYSSACFKQPEENEEDELLSQSSLSSAAGSIGNITSLLPPFPKQLIVRRKILGEDGATTFQTEIIKDSRIIIEYLEQKRFEEIARKRKQTSASVPGTEQSQELEEESGPMKKMKCGNCGQYGHMKTNRSCPMYAVGGDTEESEIEAADQQKNKVIVRRQAITELSRILGKIVTDITNIPNSWPFHLPVQEKIAPGYHSIVKAPMDFSTLRKNVSSRKYLSPSQFLEDVNLIYQNCVSYNGAEHPFSMIALNIIKKVQEALEEVLSNLHH